MQMYSKSAKFRAKIYSFKGVYILSGTGMPNTPIPVLRVLAVRAASCNLSIFFSSVSAFVMECSAYNALNVLARLNIKMATLEGSNAVAESSSMLVNCYNCMVTSFSSGNSGVAVPVYSALVVLSAFLKILLILACVY